MQVRLLGNCQSAQAKLIAITTDFESSTPSQQGGFHLKMLLAARVTYVDAVEALEAHKRQHGCAALD